MNFAIRRAVSRPHYTPGDWQGKPSMPYTTRKRSIT